MRSSACLARFLVVVTVLGSLIAASLGYVAMSNAQAEHLVFMFPELLLVALAGTLVMGRYTGYRLTELRRFKALAR